MNRLLNIWLPALVAALVVSVAASADCVLPAPPSRIPDGSSANEQEMVAAMRTLKQYNDDVNEYTQCLQFEEKRNRITDTEQEKHREVALSALKTVADRFNEEVRRFKSRRS